LAATTKVPNKKKEKEENAGIGTERRQKRKQRKDYSQKQKNPLGDSRPSLFESSPWAQPAQKWTGLAKVRKSKKKKIIQNSYPSMKSNSRTGLAVARRHQKQLNTEWVGIERMRTTSCMRERRITLRKARKRKATNP